MAHARSGAHDLDVPRARAAGVAQAVLVGDGAFADIGDDLHVGVGVRRKAGPGGDGVVVPHPDRAPTHPGGIVVAGEGEVVLGVEPAVVGAAEAGEGPAFDHVMSPCVSAVAPFEAKMAMPTPQL